MPRSVPLAAVLLLLSCLPRASGCTGTPGPEDAGEGEGYVAAERPDAGEEPLTPADLALSLERSANAKILAQLEDGGIDLKTAALYQLYAAYAPHLLAPEFADEGTAPLLTAFHWSQLALQSRADYPAAERANLDAILARPGTAGFRNFVNAPPSSTPRCLGSMRNGDPVQKVDESAHFVFYVQGTSLSAEGGDPATAVGPLAARLAAALATPVSNRGLVMDQPSLKAFFEATWKVYSDLGFTAPLLPDMVAEGGKIPVYVLGCGNLREDAGASGRGSIYLSVALAFEDPQLRKVVLPHELAHLFTADAASLGPHHAWPFEAMAVALEDQVARDVKRWSKVPAPGTRFEGFFQAMNRSFSCPEEPFHSSNFGRCRVAVDGKLFEGRTQPRYDGDYSKFVFFKWYQQQHEGNPRALATWWRRYAPQGNPKALVTVEELSAFQLALLGDVYGEKEAFEVEDRARFVDPAAQLDFAPTLRERYTFRFEEPQYWPNRGRLAPGVNVSLKPPRSPDNDTFRLQPGASLRVLVEIPRLSLPPLVPALPSVVFDHQGAKPTLKFRYVDGPALWPSRQFLGFDASLAAVEAGTDALLLSPTAPRSLLIIATIPPATGTPPTRLRFGVTIGDFCAEQCGRHFKPAFDNCCGPWCGGDELCTSECKAETRQSRAGSDLCVEYCWGKIDSYLVSFAGDAHSTVAPRICDEAGVSCDLHSGLVPIPRFVDANCEELGMAP